MINIFLTFQNFDFVWWDGRILHFLPALHSGKSLSFCSSRFEAMLWFRIKHFLVNADPDLDLDLDPVPDPDPHPVFLWHKIFNFTAETKILFFDQKFKSFYSWASTKDVQATGEAFSSQKRTYRTTKHEISSLLFVGVIFALLDPDPHFPGGSATLTENKIGET